jgi:hypothetical protein
MTKSVASFLDDIAVSIKPTESILDALVATPSEATPSEATPSGSINPDDILRVGDVRDKDLQWFLDQLADGGFLAFYGKAYSIFKRLLADNNGYKAQMIREDERAWLESRWVSQDNPDIHVDYRVPFYENDSGHTVTGKRITLDGWVD